MQIKQFDPSDKKARMQGIGGSDASAIMGLNPYKTPYRVYLEKIGETPETDLSENPKVEWGLRLEAVVAQKYGEVIGKKVFPHNETLYHPTHHFIYAHPDFITESGDIFEVKTSSTPKLWGDPGTDQVPETYIVQCLHYLSIIGASVMDLAVLTNGYDFRVYHIKRDDDLINKILKAEVDFWEMIQNKTPPDSRLADINLIYPRDDGSKIEASPQIVNDYDRFVSITKNIKYLEKERDLLKAEIQDYMKKSNVLIDGNGKKIISWSNQTVSRFDQTSFKEIHPALFNEFKKASSNRIFRVY